MKYLRTQIIYKTLYLDYYPDCFKKIEMKKSDWISLAKKRIEWAKYALIGRDFGDEDSYLNDCNNKIKEAERLVSGGLEKKKI